MAYKIFILPQALKELSQISPPLRKKLDAKIRSLAENPRPAGVKDLQGKKEYFRVRFSDYRIIYTIEEKKLMVLVVRIGHRKEIYRALETLPDIKETLLKLFLNE